ncbi:winged helix-turn-helix domain-containing protein [Halorientalis marina]|uniref:winged helix-turn-helix domain-containing protein n=1 Tax=Halorientalis marina TaxID=2931976 RepID=UPI001FF0EC16|nr:winged helix-turn-helix domain-containing protein [Halorientalis marina]
MSTDNGSEEHEESSEVEIAEDDEGVRDRLGEEADRAVERFDESIVDLLSWILDTETRARIYVYLRQNPHSTSDEIAEGTGLYPSTVREALAELHEEEKVERRKRQSGGAGNNPYEYTAIAPSDLVSGIAGDVQSELNTVFNLDDHLNGENGDDEGEGEEAATAADHEPVTITVDEESTDGEPSDEE